MMSLGERIGPWRRRRERRRVRRALRGAGIDARGLGLMIGEGTRLEIAAGARVRIGSGVALAACRIEIASGAEVVFGDGTVVQDAVVRVGAEGTLRTGRGSHLTGAPPATATVGVVSGSLEIADEATCRGAIHVRHGGRLRVGVRTFLNPGSDVRCDTAVTVGDYTMVSYDVYITDTNAHSLDWRVRRETIAGSPPHTLVGEPAPIARPIVIGDDCWIGKRAVILKGVAVGDRAIVGAAAVVTRNVPAESTAVGNPAEHRPIVLSEKPS